LPQGWKSASPMPGHSQKGDVVDFDAVSLETLIDSPVLCGRHLRDIALGSSTGNGQQHSIAVACDSAAGVDIDDVLKANLDRLVDEAGRLFGSRPYRSYKFLFALSDSVAHFGLEHHESSDNRGPERLLADARLKKTNWGQLLPHEYVHAWNGKYRRPIDMITDDFQKPQRTKLLWVYEGLTQYLGVVLTARCGIWTPEQFRDSLAGVAAWAGNQRGRTWRPLEDTAVAAQLLYGARGEWGAWRRGTDFYDEGVLLWLDIDTLIRQKSEGKKSLDDFCRRFFAAGPNAPRVRPYNLDELVAELNAVHGYDWKAFFAKRLTTASPEPPLDGIARGGWKLAYGEKQSDFQTANDEDGKTADFSSSLGVLLKEDGYVNDVIPGSAAHKAGVGPGMKLVAVNTRRFSPQVLRDALGGDRKAGGIALLLESGDFYHTFKLDYQGGSRYPRMERDPEAPDLLGAIVQPLAK
jgi:predicted metalloprotease with PDZ domain